MDRNAQSTFLAVALCDLAMMSLAIGTGKHPGR